MTLHSIKSEIDDPLVMIKTRPRLNSIYENLKYLGAGFNDFLCYFFI